MDGWMDGQMDSQEICVLNYDVTQLIVFLGIISLPKKVCNCAFMML